MKQVVERAGIAESTVTGALYGYHEGSLRTWWTIAHALDMTPGALIDHLDDESMNITVPSSTTLID